MCITFFYLPCNLQEETLFIVFNRDESVLRLTEKLHQWEADPYLVAGTDTFFNGTWFGINTKTGNIAFLTNLEDALVDCAFQYNKLSRGDVIRKFLESGFCEKHTLESYIDDVLSHSLDFNPFNSVFGNYLKNQYYYLDIISRARKELPKNTLLGFSNNLAFTNSWPKVDKGLKLFSQIGNLTPENSSHILQVMKDTDNFGILDKKEESSIFINPYFNDEKLKVIGTISTSLLFIKNGKGVFKEFRKSMPEVEKIRQFMLARKASIKLRNYIQFVLFLSREDNFSWTDSETTVNINLY